MKKVKEGKFTFDYIEWHSISNQAKDLVNKLMEKDINKRLSAEEALKHDWFQKTLGIESLDMPLAEMALNNLRQFRVSARKKRDLDRIYK